MHIVYCMLVIYKAFHCATIVFIQLVMLLKEENIHSLKQEHKFCFTQHMILFINLNIFVWKELVVNLGYKTILGRMLGKVLYKVLVKRITFLKYYYLN